MRERKYKMNNETWNEEREYMEFPHVKIFWFWFDSLKYLKLGMTSLKVLPQNYIH